MYHSPFPEESMLAHHTIFRTPLVTLACCLMSPLVLAGDQLLEVLGTFDDELGSSIGIGDFNGDGIEDIAAAAPEDESLSFWGGTVSLWNGADGSLLHLLGGSGPEAYASSAEAISDLNGDGRDEVLVGAWLADGNGTNAGRVYIHSGADGSVLDSLEGPLAGGGFGRDITRMGDVNADGVEDFVVGAPNAQGGVVYCYSGADRSLLWQVSGTPGVFSGPLGRVIACVGDVNNDGVADLGSGRRSESTVAESAGRATIISGTDGAILHEFYGDAAHDHCGNAISAAGDLNGDGFGDIAIGYSGVDQPVGLAGLVRIHSGADRSVLREYSGWADDALPSALANCGDVNGDGVPDLAMTSPRSDLGAELAGTVRVHSGLDGALLQMFWPENGRNFGYRLTTMADRDGDGARELVVGYPGRVGNFGAITGSVRVYSTHPSTAVQTCVGPALPCPCGNTDAVGGCTNSSGQGARLLAMGSASQSSDTLNLLAFGMPTFKFGLGFVGPASAPVPFGAGVLCSGGGPIQRLSVLNTGQGGGFRYEGGIVAELGLTGQASTFFQAWFRDSASTCGASFNTSGGLIVTWQP